MPATHHRNPSYHAPPSSPHPLIVGRLHLPRKTLFLPGFLALSLGLILFASTSTSSLDPWSPFGRHSRPPDEGGVTGGRWEDWKGREERERCGSVWMDKLGEIEEDSLDIPGEEAVGKGDAEGWSLEREVEKGRNETEVLQEMVSRTKGFYVRDWPLHLGWNNIRYIVEASLLHAELLNRTLVVPTYVYARSCDFEPETCRAFAKQVHRGMTFESGEWDYLPREKQWAWMIPIELMIDISAIRLTRPLLTTSDFLTLFSLSPSLEPPRGSFPPLDTLLPSHATYFKIPNEEYDKAVTRVDRMPSSFASLNLEETRSRGLGKEVRRFMDGGEKLVENWEELKGKLGWRGGDMDLEKKLIEVGVFPLWTWRGVLGMEVIHTTDSPLKQVALGENMAGVWDDYDRRDELILHLEGETHQYRKPGALRFTSPLARAAYAKMIVYDISPPPKLLELASRLAQRMHERVGGRLWLAAHMRRGDFVRFGWAMNADSELHFQRIKSTLERGRDTLAEIKESGHFQAYPNPGATISNEIAELELPRKDDPFYIATDERNATFVAHMRDEGAVFIDDLLTFEDRREFGAWELLFGDVMGILEQSLLSHSSFIYGHALSSVAAGVVHQRARHGKDPRTALLD